ncbi:uncharacterized protein LOC110666778 [Hevea brasiliensis]|uniref:uncharacterized protein LOC110666778 n=1 Tax=Hevea brasiliensis TaxID=3981 RepID=UPI0025EBD8BA|nr:uncharacterized protein LOC110666778 [Hevea brasiliensis]
MEISIEDYEIYCNVIPVDDISEPEDNASISSDMFSIKVIATFMPHLDSAMEEEEDVDDDDESESNSLLLYANSECDTSQRTFLVERNRFLHEETSRSTVRQILLDMNVPIQEFLIDQILNNVRQIASDHYKYNMGRHKVLHLAINIEVPPIIFEAESDDDDPDGES